MKIPIFTVKKIDTPSLGAKLKVERIAQKISLEELSFNTKIQLKYLQLMEAEEYGSLPADIYVRGFLVKYADYLNLDAEPILDQFEKERGVMYKIAKKPEHQSLPSLVQRNISITPKTISISALIVLFSLGIFYVIFQWAYLLLPPKLLVENFPRDGIINVRTYSLEGETNHGNSLTINNRKIYIDKDGLFKEIINLTEGENILRLLVKNQLGRVTKEDYKLIYQP
ncbi:MAG: hypothetical protein COU81_03220 [Candidatus Portnoybacteria bacterium CG10_big_fil_rev_8_21_14_0_10_36_7]|uniref:HTH cro/C1-type domain-containing protein n=1 Tax=Candidatus Portnoybacteria bacterium CG10_big_fil_rev_8_21_14_0_10_36_7 TaxID=1974812 RepID=A0A2M8KDH3_9BACT|nr:MAG: hypothetical protein COU81_03220 [Candidatus Portnoybacteria bacterium CG10_big_fil_rev_8_21_14_0_10_36_7]